MVEPFVGMARGSFLDVVYSRLHDLYLERYTRNYLRGTQCRVGDYMHNNTIIHFLLEISEIDKNRR